MTVWAKPADPLPAADRYETAAITGKIRAYRAGRLSFAALLDQLSRHDYVDPDHQTSGKGGHLVEWEDANFHQPGTWGEIDRAWARGLLTDAEHGAIGDLAYHYHDDGKQRDGQ